MMVQKAGVKEKMRAGESEVRTGEAEAKGRPSDS